MPGLPKICILNVLRLSTRPVKFLGDIAVWYKAEKDLAESQDNVSLPFQLSLRFNLAYIDEKGKKQHPVMIHRAILCSVERIAVLTGSLGGKWPFWLSPRQAMVVPVGIPFNKHAKEVLKQTLMMGIT